VVKVIGLILVLHPKIETHGSWIWWFWL